MKIRKNSKTTPRQIVINNNILIDIDKMLTDDKVYYNNFSDLVKVLLVNELIRYNNKKQPLQY